jgi:hypothetical protein
LLFLSGWKRFRLVEWAAFGVLVGSSVYAISITSSALIQIAALHLCLVGLLYPLARSMDDAVAVDYIRNFIKIIYLLTISAAFFLVLQFALYLAFDVIPSHSHKNSILIRFRSILDDSLAFGVLLPMFAGLLYYGLKDSFLKSTCLMIVIFVAVSTGSLTAMATTAIYTLWLVRSRWQYFLAWGVLIALLVFAFRWYFLELWSAKSGSIAGHLEGLPFFSGHPWAKLESGGFAESGWILIFKNFGLLTFLILFCFHIYIQLLCVRMLNAGLDNSQYIGAVEGLNFSAFLASFNLPVLMMFPVYFLLAIFSASLCGMAAKNGIRLKS